MKGKIKQIKKSFFLIFVSFILLFSFYGSPEKMIEENDYPLITLISKSSGLENPDKEEGKTEYEVADINNDGNLDIISVGDHGSPYVNSGEHGIMVWLGDGKGNWTVQQNGDFGYGGCQIGDLNNDGYMDVVWGVHHNWAGDEFGDTLIDAALGDGSAYNWTPWGEGLAENGETWGMFATDLADFDCDGKLDILSQSFGCCNGIRVYKNLGDGNWTQKWALTGDNAMYTIETGDINGDGYMDFVSTHWVSGQGSNIAFLGDGTFNFSNHDNGLPTYINAVDCKDINNDGRDDIAVATDSGVYCYIYDVANDVWISKSNGLPSGSYDMVQLGDINGDGFRDVVCYSEPNGYVYLGDGTGNWSYSASWTMPSPGYYSALRVDGDIDHDGREDIVVQAEEGGWPTYENVLRCYSPWQLSSNLSLKVTEPDGGEVYRIGSVRYIRWLAGIPPSHENATVEIQLSLNGANGPWTTIASNLPNNGIYQWTVASSNSSNCRIKIILSTDSGSISSISPNDFCITGGNVFGTSANGPYYGFAGQAIHFTSTVFGGTPPYIWQWDFGDGNISYEQNPWHIYNSPGNYTVTLNVIDSQNNSANDTTFAFIIINTPPHANFTYEPLNPMPNQTVYFNSTSYDLDGYILNYTWQFGDGSIAYGEKATHKYSDYGKYLVNLSITDNGNASDSISKYVVVGEKINISMAEGWNLITLPVENDYNASSLFDAIEGCSIILSWNASFGDFDLYVPGSPNDFEIEDGHGYLIAVENYTQLSIDGAPIKTVSILLYEGWNMLGWFKENDTMASRIYENITSCSIVLKWNASMQDFDLYVPGSPNDFVIKRGEGFLVAVSEQSIWHGEG